ncbi:MAG: hypothetical protein AB1540_15995 [Bdellovibrionota bacterium]
MKSSLVQFALVSGFACFFAWSSSAEEVLVRCYDDDSLNAINQEQVPWPRYPSLPRRPSVLDCGFAPQIEVRAQKEIFINGRKVFDQSRSEISEVSVSPAGYLAVLTEDHRLYRIELARNGARSDEVRLWYSSLGSTSIQDFRLLRNGQLVAMDDQGFLILDGVRQSRLPRAARIMVAGWDRVFVLLADGTVVDEKASVIHHGSDDVVDLKVASNGSIVWLTARGRLGNLQTENLVRWTSSPVVSFRMNPSGQVAYLTQDGELGRENERLPLGHKVVENFTIDSEGAVKVTTDKGEVFFPRD